MLESINQRLDRRGVGGVLLALLALVYVVAYFHHPLFPGTGESALTRGWWTWTDQHRYVDEANAIANGRLDRTNYHYPLGYPAMGALFVRWLPAHPFLVPDLVLVLGAAIAWWKLARRWLTAIPALGVGVLFLMLHYELVGVTMVVPWNTVATQTLMFVALAVVLGRRAGPGTVAWLGLLGAVTYLIRPIDAVPFAPLLVFSTWRVQGGWPRLGAAAGAITLLALSVGAVAVVNQQIFGSWRTPYDDVSLRTIGFFGYPATYKFYWLLVDGRPLFAETEPALLFRYAWLFLALPAVIFLVQRERWAGFAVSLAMLVSLVVYSNYNDLLPSDIYRFTLIHYLVWLFPLLFLLAAAAIREVGRSRGIRVGLALAGVSAIVAVGLRLEPRKLDSVSQTTTEFRLPASRPLLLEFPGTPMDVITSLRLEDRSLVEYSEYLVPFVPSDLRLLLGENARGERLTVPANVRVEVSVYRWTWRLDPARVRSALHLTD